MVAHGRSVQVLRAEGCRQVGLVVNLEAKDAAGNSPADLAACVRADAYINRQFLDPALLGSCPEPQHEVFGPAWVD